MNAILELLRPRNMLISFIGVIVGVLLVSMTTSINADTIIAGFSAMIILGAGNALNDYYDSEADKTNRPNRPIPSGRISKSNVKIISILLFIAGVVAALFINVYCITLAIINSIVLIVYAKYSKKLLVVSNVMISYLTASVFIYGALSVYETMNYDPRGVVLMIILAGSSFLMTLSREVVKDIEDMNGDDKINAKTLPLKIGAHKAKEVAITAGVLAVLVSLLPFKTQTIGFDLLAYGVFIIPSNLIFISSYFKSAARSQKYLVLGMTLSLLAFLAGRII